VKRTSSYGQQHSAYQNQALNHSLGNKNGMEDLIAQMSKTGYNVPYGQRQVKSRNQYANGAKTYLGPINDNLIQTSHKVGSSLESSKNQLKQHRVALASSGQ
jgi:hypothetical protein